MSRVPIAIRLLKRCNVVTLECCNVETLECCPDSYRDVETLERWNVVRL